MANINGTGGNDVLTGTESGDNFNGLDGNDSLSGLGGDDFLNGGAGNDTIDGGAGSTDRVIYSSATTGVVVDLAAGTASDGQGGTDTLNNVEAVRDTAFNDFIRGNASSNLFEVGAGNDTIDGGAGSDAVAYFQSTSGINIDLIAGTATGAGIGTDTLLSIESVNGSYYDDVIRLPDVAGAYAFPQAGNDYVIGGAGDNTLYSSSGNDTLDGGGGSDYVSYEPNAVAFDNPGTVFITGQGVLVDLATGKATDNFGHSDTLISIEKVRGSSYNDLLSGDNNSNILWGLGGNDSLDGGAGNDNAFFNGPRADYTVVYSATTASFTIIDNVAGRDGTDQVRNVESFSFSDGTRSAAQLQASAVPDTVVPLLLGITPLNGTVAVSPSADIQISFNEAIALGSGSVVLKDADGNVVATFTAANTANLLVSGGTLTIHFTTPLATSTSYTLELGANSVKDLAGNAFAGYLGYGFTTAGTGLTLVGTAASPSVSGGAGDDTLIAGPGDATLDGGAGNDVLKGSNGSDLLLGGTGSDILISGSGADTMQGGDGADLYYVNDAGDLVTETATNSAQQPAPGGGPQGDLGRSVDKVIASINYTLTNFVENLALAAAAGNLKATGNAQNNILTGNEGNNELIGNDGDDTLIGGAGADSMYGGNGSDTYYVDDATDQVQEVAVDTTETLPGAANGKSIDKVIASINFTLGNFVENLSLAAAAGRLSGTGNDLNNVLTGNESNNVLKGAGGTDSIDGGAGADTAQYTGARSDYTLTLGGTLTVADKRSTAGNDGTDSLTSIERLQFSDQRLALDMGATQAAGKTVLMMAVATSLGPAFVGSQLYAGLFLGYFDTGASLLDGANLLVSSGIVAAFAGGNDNASLVKMVYNNVNGHAPDAATLASLVAPLNAGTLTQGQWMADMAESTANQTHVNLVGYAGTGLQYTV